jgi:hypothetical protein
MALMVPTHSGTRPLLIVQLLSREAIRMDGCAAGTVQRFGLRKFLCQRRRVRHRRNHPGGKLLGHRGHHLAQCGSAGAACMGSMYRYMRSVDGRGTVVRGRSSNIIGLTGTPPLTLPTPDRACV